MKIVIFAGGSGRRLWPLSRVASPKQFEPIIGHRSTLRLAVDRVLDHAGAENVFISTNERYLDLVREQLPELPVSNLIGEPARRDLAAAVGLAMTHLAHHGQPDEPVAILWGDNYMDNVPAFLDVLSAAETLVRQESAKIVFVGETPRFANDNLGWIGLGPTVNKVNGRPCFAFESLRYRPPLAECERMYEAGSHVWNTGYFVTTPAFVLNAYAEYEPTLHARLGEIGSTIGQAEYEAKLHKIYPHLPVKSFDDAILENLDPGHALVLHADMGWSDPGTLYALKEALSKAPNDNVVEGLVACENVEDSLLYNYESEKLLAVVGLSGVVVVNMDDALLVVHKSQIPLVKKLVNSMVGSELQSYT